MEDNIIERLVQIGTVTAVQGTKARVMFNDSNMTSDWLCVLQRTGETVALKNSGTHTHVLSSGTAENAGSHKHDASVTTWVPTVGQTVVVLYLPIFDSDGFIIGGI